MPPHSRKKEKIRPRTNRGFGLGVSCVRVRVRVGGGGCFGLEGMKWSSREQGKVGDIWGVNVRTRGTEQGTRVATRLQTIRVHQRRTRKVEATPPPGGGYFCLGQVRKQGKGEWRTRCFVLKKGGSRKGCLTLAFGWDGRASERDVEHTRSSGTLSAENKKKK